MSSSEYPDVDPPGPKSGTKQENEKKGDVYYPTINFGIRGVLKLIFCRRKSNWRCVVFTGVGGFFTYGAAFYYNNRHTDIVLEVVVSMLILGSIFIGLLARQLALNFGRTDWANTSGWITFAAYWLLAIGSLFIEPRPGLEPTKPPTISTNSVHLSDGTNILGTKILVTNPNDVDLYDIRIVLLVNDGVVPMKSISLIFGDKPGAKETWVSEKPLEIDFTLDGSGYYYGVRPLESVTRYYIEDRIVDLHHIPPRQSRDLWVQGTILSNSYLNLTLFAYETAPLSVKYLPDGGWLWPIARSNSPYWSIIHANPMDLDLEVRAELATNHATIPSHP